MKISMKNLDTSRLSSMQLMFATCKANEIDLTGMNVSNITDMSFTFFNCEARLTGLQNLYFSKIEDMIQAFAFCKSPDIIINITPEKSSYKKIDMEDAFRGCSANIIDFMDSYIDPKLSYTKDTFKDCIATKIILKKYKTKYNFTENALYNQLVDDRFTGEIVVFDRKDIV